MGPSVRVGEPEWQPGEGVSADPEVRRVLLHSGAILLVGGMAAAAFALDWDSPVRVVLAIGFLLFGPGLAVGELLGVREPVQRLALATGASLALETLVGLTLVYAGAYSAKLAFAIVLALSASALATAVVRAVHMSGSGHGDYTLGA